MGRLGFPEILIIAVVMLVLFGSKKLPEFGNSLGKFLREFKKAARETEEDITNVTKDKGNEQK